MVRAAEYRQRKYEGKIDPEVVRLRIEAHRETMATQQTTVLPLLTAMEEKVKAYIESPPPGVTVYSIEIPFYLSFARQLFRLCRRTSGDVLKTEAQLVANKWASRGLNGTLLVGIAKLFGIEITTPVVYGA